MRAAVENTLHAIWAHRGPAACLLYPLSLIYRAVARSRAKAVTPVELPVPVIVVGNIYVGGTGKTPITIELTRVLRQAGFVPGVISRGYGRSAVNDAIMSVDDSLFMATVEKLIEKKYPAPPSGKAERDKMCSALSRMGYSLSEIFEAMKKVYGE